MNSRKINCTVFGELRIQEYTTVGQLDKYFNASKSNPIIAIDNLLSEIILDDIESKELTDNDKLCILLELAGELEVQELFKNELTKSSNYYEAFGIAFQESDYFKSLTKTYTGIESLIAPSIAFKKMSETFLKNQSFLSSMREAANAISKQIHPGIYDISKIVQPYNSIYKSIHAYQNTVKSIQFPLTNQLLTSQIIQQRQLVEQTKSFNDIFKLSSLNIEILRNLSAQNKKLFEPITILSKRYAELNNVFGLTDNAFINIKQNLDFIKSATQINWIDQLNITAKLINNCNIAIVSTNDYFVDSNAINTIITEDLELKPEQSQDITDSIVHSESIIQDKAGASIIIQSEFANILFEKIDALLEKKYKSVFDHFERFLKPQAFSEFLDEFAQLVTREYWQQFWVIIGDKFKPSPESIAKSNLGLFLSGRYSNIAFIGQELIAGNGFVDLLVNYLGLNYLIELKVIGANTSISWAKSGIEQLNDYMIKYNLDKGYLVVYDGRKTNRGEQLNEYYDVSNGRIFVKNIKIYHE